MAMNTGMGDIRQIMSAATLCLVLFFSLTASAARGATPDPVSAPIPTLPFAGEEALRDMPMTPGSIRIGCPTDFPPYAFLDEKGRLAGIYPELIAALNLRLNGLLQAVPLEGNYPSGNILAQWPVEAIIGPAQELPANARLSMSLFRSQSVYLGPEHSNGARLLRKNPLRVIALPHTPALTAVRSQYPNMSFTYRRNLDAAVQAVRSGEGGLIVGEELSVQAGRRTLPEGFSILGQMGGQYHGIGVRPDLDNVLTLLDNALLNLPPQERESILNAWRGAGQTLHLTGEEKAWLADNPTVRVAVYSCMPYAGMARNELVGMAASYLERLGRKLHVTFRPVPVADRQAALHTVQEGRADMLAVLSVTRAEKEGLLVTRPWLDVSVAIASPRDAVKPSLASLNGQSLSVIRHSLPARWIAANNPGITLLPETDGAAALEGVVKGRVQATAGALDSLIYYIRRDRLDNISISGFTPYTLKLSFATRADLPLLQSALDKGLAAIPPAVSRQIYLQWAQAVEVPFMDWEMFWRYVLGALFCMLCIVGGFAHVNRKLRREIRERQKAEGILKLIFEYMPAALTLCDAQSRCIDSNRGVAEAYGLRQEDLIGKSFVQAGEEAALPLPVLVELRRLESVADQAFATRRCQDSRHGNPLNEGQAHFNTWFMPLFDKNGKPDCLIVLSVDITPAIRLEQELRQRLSLSQEIMNSLPLPVCVHGNDGAFLVVNKAYGDFMGLPATELPGKSVQDLPLLTPKQREHYGRQVAALLTHGGSVREETCFPDPDGSTRTVLTCLSSFVVAEGEAPLAAGAILDISERKALEEDLRAALAKADKASRAKSDFLAHMSHELRTPMNGILGLSELLLHGDLTANQRDFLEKIHFSARILVRIIGNILEFSRLQSDTLCLNDSAFDLREVLDSVRAALAPGSRAKGLSFRYSIAPGTPCRLRGDGARLSQVLLALAGNAVKFTEQGGVCIQAALAEKRDEQALLDFEVCDSGIGLADADPARLFEPFAQGDAGISRRHGGAGLGLTIARKLVEAMRGEISCESAPGKGSCFSFTALFDLARPPDAAKGEAPADRRETAEKDAALSSMSPAIRGRRVLLAEDNPVNQLVARELLAALGARVDTADDGLEAVEKARRNSYDCIIMDIQMPRMDGLTATRMLRDDPAFDVPVVALTAHALEEDVRKSLDAGMAAHLAKPVDPAELSAVLSRLLERE